MRKWSVLVGAALVALTLTACKGEEPVVQPEETATAASTLPMEATPTPAATPAPVVAQLSGPAGASGMVTFTAEADGKVHVVARVEGAKPGKHGLHVHEGTTCDGPDFKSAGAHFDVGGHQHGGPGATSHSGDWGNIEVGADGTGNLDLVTDQLSIDQGPNAVVGKVVILHAGEDDLTTQPSGNSGDRIACGPVQAPTAAAVEPATSPAMEASPSATAGV